MNVLSHLDSDVSVEQYSVTTQLYVDERLVQEGEVHHLTVHLVSHKNT